MMQHLLNYITHVCDDKHLLSSLMVKPIKDVRDYIIDFSKFIEFVLAHQTIGHHLI